MKIRCLLTLSILLILGSALPGCGDAVSSQPTLRGTQKATDKISVNDISTNRAKLSVYEQNFIINTAPEKYTYDDFIADLNILNENYCDRIKCVKLCDTADGRG